MCFSLVYCYLLSEKKNWRKKNPGGKENRCFGNCSLMGWGGGGGGGHWELFSWCYFHICCLLFSVSFLFWGGGGGGCNFTHMTSLNWGRQKGELGHSTVFYYGGGGDFYSPLWFGEGEGKLGSFYRNLWLVALFWRLKVKGVNARCEYRLWDCSSLALSCPHPCVLCVGVCVCACAHCFSHSKCERPVRLRISCMVMCGQRKWSGHSVCCPRACGEDVKQGYMGVCLFWIRIFNVSCEIVSCSLLLSSSDLWIWIPSIIISTPPHPNTHTLCFWH